MNEMRRNNVNKIQTLRKPTIPTISIRKHQEDISSLKTMATSPLPFNFRFSQSCLIVTLLATSASILLLAATTYSNQVQQEIEVSSFEKGFASPSVSSSTLSSSSSSSSGIKPMNSLKGKKDKEEQSMKSDNVQMSLPYGSGSDKKTLSYYHCGVTISTDSYSSKDKEILLLHGAKFTKEDWAESNILQNLCIKGNQDISKHGRISVTALDLSVKADGKGLKSAFDALVEKGTLSGNPVVVVTPSASGKSIVSMVTTEGMESLLKEVVKVWMPVASFAVLSIGNDDAFKVFKEFGIPILAMNGDSDVNGKKVTSKLVEVANAKGIEMKGGHPCYLDSPTKFEDSVLSFLEDLETDLS